MAHPRKLASLEDTNQGTASCFHGTLSISSGNDISDPVFIPTSVKNTSCGLTFLDEVSSGRFEYTISHPNAVEADEANWRVWPDGDVSVDTDNLLIGPVTALRAVCVEGSLTYEIAGS